MKPETGGKLMHEKIKKILVVDDEESITRLMKSMLSAYGYEAVLAGNGKQGLELYKTEKPDLIITDIIMPDMEGIELIRILRKIDKKLPIIVMSGDPTGKKFLKTASLLGAHSTLNKPFSAEELMNLIYEIENSYS